jgi:hypothetical protein
MTGDALELGSMIESACGKRIAIRRDAGISLFDQRQVTRLSYGLVPVKK